MAVSFCPQHPSWEMWLHIPRAPQGATGAVPKIPWGSCSCAVLTILFLLPAESWNCDQQSTISYPGEVTLNGFQVHISPSAAAFSVLAVLQGSCGTGGGEVWT